MSTSVSKPSDPRPHPADYRAHHPAPGTKQFTNPWPSSGTILGPATFLKAGLRGELSSKPLPADVLNQVGWRKLNLTYTSGSQDKVKASWLGHASMFLEFPHGAIKDERSRGLRLLCDPIFSDRCSPTQYFGGPKRFTPASTSISELPEIDIVCISHNHYDHLDHGTITALSKKYPDVTYFVPIGGVKRWFIRCGISASRVHEMDWWDELVYERKMDDSTSLSLRVGYLPAQHFTGRGLSDQGQTLWGSYSLESSSFTLDDQNEERKNVKKVWFAGDTGRRTISRAIEVALTSTSQEDRQHGESALAQLDTCPAHREIGTLRGPFDLAIIPIGAYSPRYLMSRVHVDPAEAIEIFKEVDAKQAVGIHWGTFQLSNEDVLEPKLELRRLLQLSGLKNFDCWDMGEVKYI